jgi:hypothetical protein
MKKTEGEKMSRGEREIYMVPLLGGARGGLIMVFTN